MRDALSLTDQAIAYAAGNVTLEAVQGMLGALDQSYLIRLLDALATQDGAGLLAIADEMATRSLSYSAALQDLGSLLHRIALAQTVPAAVPEDAPEREDIMRLAAVFDAEEVQLYYQIAVHGRNELGLAPDEYAGFSMTLLRMLAFRPGIGGAEAKPAAVASVPASAPAARLSAVPQAATASAPAARPAAGMSPARAALEAARNGTKMPPPAAATAAPVAATSKPVNSTAAPPPWEQDQPFSGDNAALDVASVAAQKKTEPDAAEVKRIAASATPAPMQPAPLVLHPIPELNWDGNWPTLAAILPVRGVAQQLAQQSELVRCESGSGAVEFHLRVAVETLLSAGSPEKLATALTEHFGQPVRLATEIGAVQQTANAKAIAEREERQRKAEETMQSDPFVQTLMREFGATIVPGSIKPI
jgi:DNA polymerase-3 subunit gamma/tau